jgi:hypothetical protein
MLLNLCINHWQGLKLSMQAVYGCLIRMVVLLDWREFRRSLFCMNINLLPPYESKCKLLNLDTLCRRDISSVMFVRYVLCARIDSSSLLAMLALTANPHRTRSRALLLERFHRTAYGLNEPLNCAIRKFNNEIQCDFCVSREGFRELLRRNVQ